MKHRCIPQRNGSCFYKKLSIFLASASCLIILLCNETSAASSPVPLFDTGRGTDVLDVRHTPFYESIVAFTPSIGMKVRAMKPAVLLCNGTCMYSVQVFDAKNILIGEGNEDEARAILFDGTLQNPVTMLAGKTYKIAMRIESNKEVGIYTTGQTRRWMRRKNGTFETLSAGWLHPTKERGAIAFTIIGIPWGDQKTLLQKKIEDRKRRRYRK